MKRISTPYDTQMQLIARIVEEKSTYVGYFDIQNTGAYHAEPNGKKITRQT